MLHASFVRATQSRSRRFRKTWSPTATNLQNPNGHLVPVPPSCKRNPAGEESDIMYSHYICRTLHAHLHVQTRMHLHHSGIWPPGVQPQPQLKMHNCAGTGAGKCSLGRTGYCSPVPSAASDELVAAEKKPRTNRLLQVRDTEMPLAALSVNHMESPKTRRKSTCSMGSSKSCSGPSLIPM